MPIDFKPLFDRILIRPISSEETISGIIIPDSSSNLKKGIVIAVGEGKDGNAMTVSVDQTVMYKGDGTPITLDGEQYLILKEQDVWMVK
jgi:chaperonin GroES